MSDPPLMRVDPKFKKAAEEFCKEHNCNNTDYTRLYNFVNPVQITNFEVYQSGRKKGRRKKVRVTFESDWKALFGK